MNLLSAIALICTVTLRSMEFHILIYLLSVDWNCRVHFDNSNVIKQKNGSFDGFYSILIKNRPEIYFID